MDTKIMCRFKSILCLFVSITMLSATLAGCGGGAPMRPHFIRGVDAQDDGDLHGAIAAYQLALEDVPEDFRINYNLALIYHDLYRAELASGSKASAGTRHAEATAQYQRVLELSADNIPARLGLAQMSADSGDVELASTRLQDIEGASESDQQSIWMAQAQLAVLSGDSGRQRLFLEKVLEVDAASARAVTVMARIQLAAGNVAEAEAILEPAIQVHPHDLGLLSVAAAASLKRAQLLQQACSSSEAALVDCTSKLAAIGVNASAADRDIAAAACATATGVLSAAKSAVVSAWVDADLRHRRLLTLSARDYQALMGLSRCLEGQGDIGGAIDFLWRARRTASNRAIQLNGENPGDWHLEVQQRLNSLYKRVAAWEAGLILPSAANPQSNP